MARVVGGGLEQRGSVLRRVYGRPDRKAEGGVLAVQRRLTTILLVIWFVVTYLISGLWAGALNQYSLLGFPLGYYMAAQGALAIFVVEIAVYAYLMNRRTKSTASARRA